MIIQNYEVTRLPVTPFRSKQDKERKHRPQGVYSEVHDQGGAKRDAVLRRL